jgi:cytidylate kinase
MIIAVDGPAASGKGTLAKRLAAHYGLSYLDSGALYRAVARDMLSSGVALTDRPGAEQAAHGLDPSSLDDPALRTFDVGKAASVIAQYPEVRAVLLDRQRAIAKTEPGAVLDGRDIGTIVCPNADVKLFVVASPEERARRRHKELQAAGNTASFDVVLEEIERRDARDRDRATAPLQQASDAHLLDTTILDIEAAFKVAVDLIDAAMGPTGRET